ncbi:ATP-dependent Clp protease ATP-binding subunit [Actinomadura spongiicola]|uniref:ATP-dependent Clp protease ATP-binding subunit n=1 Tax=Actinomadura spongiicola TaxID=2303421 RepID=A0A372GPH5_9ACTN|nr:AAA family ATPase [Actinomadura spongiicola]RFS86983.1 ATP-dependent Clp protease ATP-binding subunit [Actinomadura spongiicola]
MLFDNGVFDPRAVDDPRTVDVLHAAVERAAGSVRTSDLLRAALASKDAPLLTALGRALPDGVQVRHLLEGIEIYSPARAPGSGADEFGGGRDEFSAESLAALDAFGEEYGKSSPDERRATALELLVACVLEHLEARDRQNLVTLDAPAAAAVLRTQVRAAREPLPSLLDEESGRLRSEEFTQDAWSALEQAAEQAALLGYDRVLPPHCLLALLGETEGLAEHLVRLQVAPQVGPAKVAATVADAFRLIERPRTTEPLPLDRAGLGEPFLAMLGRARRAAASWNAERIDAPHLLGAVLAEMPPRLDNVLRAPPLRLDPSLLRDHLDEALRQRATTQPREVAFRLPATLPPAQDLTWLARTDEPAPALHVDRYFDPLLRALHRASAPHVLITGMPGVGTTTLVRELARRAAIGQIPFLRRKRFLYVDCRDVTPTESGTKLSGLIEHVTGRTDLVVCVDGLGSLLRGPSGADHRLPLRAAMKERRIHLIGVLSVHDHDDLIASDRALSELCARIEVDEPGRAEALEMAAQAAEEFASRFKLRVDERAVERAVLLSVDFMLNERLPAKAVRVLRRACEDLHYRRTQAGSDQEAVRPDDVAAVVAEFSGVPVAQIAGTGGERIDLERALGESVVGQPEAVRVVAGELRRIKAGLASPGRPASVMLFAGLTGVGKTELAKTIARFYSASKRIQTYPMENFTEPHSVAGILGSPPGYVGHDQGGRLINDLNADPYCVFLLDEAEKAHPEVWRPFLNLFDEGWIVDQRGTKAFGDRAIFVLTTNAGHDIIARMAAEGRPMQETADAVERHLRQVRHPRSGEVVFPPEFLARLRQIVIFRPLDRAAMEGICRQEIARQRRFWRDRREKRLVVPEALIGHIADRGHAANEAAGGARGGRIISRLVSQLVEDPITIAAERAPDAFHRCGRVELRFRPGGEPQVEAVFLTPEEQDPAVDGAAAPGDRRVRLRKAGA